MKEMSTSLTMEQETLPKSDQPHWIFCKDHQQTEKRNNNISAFKLQYHHYKKKKEDRTHTKVMKFTFSTLTHSFGSSPLCRKVELLFVLLSPT